jgi:hypothetical protein
VNGDKQEAQRKFIIKDGGGLIGANKKSCPFGTAFNLIGFNNSNSER